MRARSIRSRRQGPAGTGLNIGVVEPDDSVLVHSEYLPESAFEAIVPPDADPVYLYVPPGQVRKWKQNCARWKACAEPVLFVRVDNSPSQWGKWRHLRDQVAVGERNTAE